MSVFLFNKSIWKNGWKDFIVLIDLQLSGRVSWLRSGCLNSEHSCALSYFTLPNALHFGNRLICDIICTAKFNFLIQWQLSGKWPKSNDHACVRWPHLSQSISINLNLIDPWIMAVMPACLPSYATLFAGQIKLCSLNHCNHTYFQKKKKKNYEREEKVNENRNHIICAVKCKCQLCCDVHDFRRTLHWLCSTCDWCNTLTLTRTWRWSSWKIAQTQTAILSTILLFNSMRMPIHSSRHLLVFRSMNNNKFVAWWFTLCNYSYNFKFSRMHEVQKYFSNTTSTRKLGNNVCFSFIDIVVLIGLQKLLHD